MSPGADGRLTRLAALGGRGQNRPGRAQGWGALPDGQRQCRPQCRAVDFFGVENDRLAVVVDIVGDGYQPQRLLRHGRSEADVGCLFAPIRPVFDMDVLGLGGLHPVVPTRDGLCFWPQT